MKSILQKILKDHSKKKANDKEQTNGLKLAHLTSYKSVQKRALVGWIASKCAATLNLDESEREALFFLSFITESFEELEDGIVKELMILANSAVNWVESDAVIEEEVKSVHSSYLEKDALTRVFSEIQSDYEDNSKETNECEAAWEVYRDVIYAATHGQFLLINKDDVSRYRKGVLLGELDITERKHISVARKLAKSFFYQNGIPSATTLNYNLVISEAVTNVLKHATRGKVSFYQFNDSFHIIVEDQGTGFPLKILPKTTLMAGFSTKESLGQGFTLMMKMASQVVLETSASGSTLILVLNAENNHKRNDIKSNVVKEAIVM
ncbi:Anti-sigma regulatory factor (Ser/Thr protein kinase) [Oceanobacillus limi]|uniref:Anti-sigma regulatory factor (Ser/Thr protein kinase) n=1 Tax=Oceanobacillus limi TaxID=930131 RepID=A0A1I0BPD3_9BACI|nr:ATP-binding protein [Oceanobacillus limi]SET08135.1 Anti-sigma regulatory factor (Ser/Thr protein kinase) [Oceanobacillus limi]